MNLENKLAHHLKKYLVIAGRSGHLGSKLSELIGINVVMSESL